MDWARDALDPELKIVIVANFFSRIQQLIIAEWELAYAACTLCFGEALPEFFFRGHSDHVSNIRACLDLWRARLW